MRLGVDFGTTRIIVSWADRGNFPLVAFDSGEAIAEWFPPLVALRGHGAAAERRFGWAAWNTQGESGWIIIRSLKRYLEDSSPETRIEAGGEQYKLSELLHGVTWSLREELSARFGATEPLEIMLGVPAHANSNQRFLTVDAFQRAGFHVLGLLNEPSAASIEFGHRQKFAGRVLVYDLGGGTFDASLVDLNAQEHTVIATEGISNLGGDDFDGILAELAVGDGQLATLEAAELFRLEEECRRQKEALHPNSRRIVVDLDEVRDGMGSATIQVPEFYERCKPLLEQTVASTVRLAERGEIDALYVTGGGSELPIVARVLREEFGKKVKRSEYTRSATAIGLAIQAGGMSRYTLREVFTRNFGVWRESDAGRQMWLDVIFPAGTPLPTAKSAAITVTRTYSPTHNIGHFRYLEATQVTDAGQPAGDITSWDEILFPFDPALGETENLGGVHVQAGDFRDQQIEEQYSCDAAGVVTVTIRNLTTGYRREYRLGQWSGKTSVVKPTAKRKRATI